MDGRYVTVTLSCRFMTSATTTPTWLFISVTPALPDAVLSALYGLSAVLKEVLAEVTASAPRGCRDRDRCRSRRTGSSPCRGCPRNAGACGRPPTTGAASCGRPREPAAPTSPATRSSAAGCG